LRIVLLSFLSSIEFNDKTNAIATLTTCARICTVCRGRTATAAGSAPTITAGSARHRSRGIARCTTTTGSAQTIGHGIVYV
jgi:hypothetical protein